MKKQRKSIKLIAKLLVLTLCVGMLAVVPPVTAQAATNKALQMKVSFNGKRNGDSAYTNNTYSLVTGYKKNAKVKTNMKVSGKVYVPVSALKKEGDIIHVNVCLDLCNTKGKYVGFIGSNYTVMLIKDGKKIRLARWNASKEKEEKIGSFATYKKSGNYYVITLKNIPLENKYVDTKGKKVSLNTKTTYELNQTISVTGTCTKTTNKYVYIDDLTLNGVSAQKVTFDKKDYRFVDGNYKDKTRSVKITKIQ